MNIFRHYLLLIICSNVLLLVSGCTPKNVEDGTTIGQFSAHLNERIPHLMDYYNIPGVCIAVVKNGTLKWSNAYGYADIENEQPLTSGTIFRAESITKSVTAWGIMNLVERGKIALDDPVANYLTRWEFHESEFLQSNVTFRSVLSHSAGINSAIYTDYPPDKPLPLLEDVLDGANGNPGTHIIQEPGISFLYSNPGFILLELLTEEVTDTAFAGYMQSSILTPLGMGNSTFSFVEVNRSRITSTYLLNGDAVPLQREAVKAHGGLYTTVDDLARFVTASVRSSEGQSPANGVLSKASVKELHTPVISTKSIYALVSDESGFGHFIEYLATGQKAVSHGGQGTGTITWMYQIPETGDGVVILTNSERSFRFIAQILRNWTQWMGISPVGLSRLYSTVIPLVWILFISLCLLSAWLVWQTGNGLRLGRRTFAPFASRNIYTRSITGGFAVVIIGVSVSLSTHKMFLIFLPVLSGWLIPALILFACILLAQTMFVRNTNS